MQPFYFRSSDARLFGALHSPPQEVASSTGVVLCNPLGFEYYRSHRALRHLAQRLARSGFHVLRFDYTGCGDSSGDDEDVTIERSLADISRAVDELRRRTRCTRITLGGRRLGATLATACATHRGDVEGLILWDPVVEGSAFLADMELVHRHWVTAYRGSESLRQQEPEELQRQPGEPLEAVGFTFSPSLVAAIAALDIEQISTRPADTVLILDTRTTPSTEALGNRLRELGSRVRRVDTADPEAWDFDEIEELLKQLVPNPLLQEMLAWQTGEFG